MTLGWLARSSRPCALADSIDTVGAYERPLSLRTMITRLSPWPMLLIASYAMPPVIDPSPMHGDDVAVVIGAEVTGDRHAVGVRQDRRGVAVLDVVVLGFLAARVAGQATLLAELFELASGGR